MSLHGTIRRDWVKCLAMLMYDFFATKMKSAWTIIHLRTSDCYCSNVNISDTITALAFDNFVDSIVVHVYCFFLLGVVISRSHFGCTISQHLQGNVIWDIEVYIYHASWRRVISLFHTGFRRLNQNIKIPFRGTGTAFDSWPFYTSLRVCCET